MLDDDLRRKCVLNLLFFFFSCHSFITILLTTTMMMIMRVNGLGNFHSKISKWSSREWEKTLECQSIIHNINKKFHFVNISNSSKRLKSWNNCLYFFLSAFLLRFKNLFSFFLRENLERKLRQLRLVFNCLYQQTFFLLKSRIITCTFLREWNGNCLFLENLIKLLTVSWQGIMRFYVSF